MRVSKAVAFALAAYVFASLLHFAHNAEYAADYPNLPASLTWGRIYAVWLAQATLGGIGFFLYAGAFPLIGLALIGLYGALGFDGLLHYHLAPASAHTAMMNFTIGLEAVAAAALIVAVAVRIVRR